MRYKTKTNHNLVARVLDCLVVFTLSSANLEMQNQKHEFVTQVFPRVGKCDVTHCSDKRLLGSHGGKDIVWKIILGVRFTLDWLGLLC